MNSIGKKVLDIGPLLALFEAQEGEVQHIIGKTGQGKTYEATRRAVNYLYQGYTVYTTWRLNLPEYYDERERFWPVIRNLLFFRKNFFRFDLKNNWHYLNLDGFTDKDGAVDTQLLSNYLAKLTDCIVFMDEGQDVFDSRERSGKAARQSITRTRHMHKTLIIISQRAMAVDVTARGNVTYFYRCVKVLSWPWAYFKVYRTDEIEEANSMPLWVRHNSVGDVIWQAQLWHRGFARSWIYDAYDSWYMRQAMIRSQDLKIDAYALTLDDKMKALWWNFCQAVVIPMWGLFAPLRVKIKGYGIFQKRQIVGQREQRSLAEWVGGSKETVKEDEKNGPVLPVNNYGTLQIEKERTTGKGRKRLGKKLPPKKALG